MKNLTISKLFIFAVLILSVNGCAFEENREVEKKLTESVNDFHNLFSQEKFDRIYSESDEELKNKFTKQQFTSYLKSLKIKDEGKIEKISKVWLDDELKDALKRILIRKTKFSHVELVSTESAIYREKFEWNLRGEKPKLVSFYRQKICGNPCQLDIKTK